MVKQQRPRADKTAIALRKRKGSCKHASGALAFYVWALSVLLFVTTLCSLL